MSKSDTANMVQEEEILNIETPEPITASIIPTHKGDKRLSTSRRIMFHLIVL